MAIVGKSVGVPALMLGRTLDVAERWDNCSTVDWLVVDDSDCRKSDSDQRAARIHSMADYMSPDCNCYHGYLNRMDLRVYCQGSDSNLHLHVIDENKIRNRERKRERERETKRITRCGRYDSMDSIYLIHSLIHSIVMRCIYVCGYACVCAMHVSVCGQ